MTLQMIFFKCKGDDSVTVSQAEFAEWRIPHDDQFPVRCLRQNLVTCLDSVPTSTHTQMHNSITIVKWPAWCSGLLKQTASNNRTLG